MLILFCMPAQARALPSPTKELYPNAYIAEGSPALLGSVHMLLGAAAKDSGVWELWVQQPQHLPRILRRVFLSLRCFKPTFHFQKSIRPSQLCAILHRKP